MRKMIENEFDMMLTQLSLLKKQSQKICQVIDICIKALKNSSKIMFCGNGGSASQAQHLSAELVGRYKLDRPGMNSIALTTDTSNLTAIGNDYGFRVIFSRQVEGLGKMGDVLFGLSTSGNSENITEAFKVAKEKGITTIALTGEKESKMSALADITVKVPSFESNHIQEMHLIIGHLICGEIEKAMYPKKVGNDD